LIGCKERKKAIKINTVVMVKTNKRSTYITRSMVKPRQASRVSCNQQSALTRVQLLKRLKEIGIKVPSGMSIVTLRALAAHNDHPLPTVTPINMNASEDDSVRSYQDVGLDSDPHVFESAQACDSLPAVKTVPRTYSLFNCQVADFSDALSAIEYIAPSLRKAIQEGKDVCLAHLLMPPEHSASQYKDNHREFTSLYLKSSDPRLHRSLSLPDFLLAFVRYMNVMTEVHPERRAELTHYLSFVVKLAVQFPPPLFYEYHKHFSRKAASILASQGRKIDWAVRDDDLYFQIFAGRRARTCEKCSSVDHSTDFCPAVLHADLKTEFFTSASTDGRSRLLATPRARRSPIMTNDQREVCFNFNGYRGCVNTACLRAHVCLKCLQPHSQKDCRQTSVNAAT
jgi:hypothetical protein